jgi:RNA polymerase sigma factor (sigma-70 family)
VVSSLASDDHQVRRQAFDALVTAYWKPVYKYLRLKWRTPADEAQDLTQDFFARALEKRFFHRYDPDKARFRTFVRTCVDGFAANQLKARSRLKRGGAHTFVSLDFVGAERELEPRQLASETAADEYFYQEWVRHLFTRAVERLRAHCRETDRLTQFAVFRRYDLEAPERDEKLTYQQLARELDLATTDVTNHLSAMRREFRAVVLEELRAISASDEEFRTEAMHLLGIRPER